MRNDRESMLRSSRPVVQWCYNDYIVLSLYGVTLYVPVCGCGGRSCVWGCGQGWNCGGSRRIVDPAPLIWDPLITDPVPHNCDPAPFCWDPTLCTVYVWVFFCVCIMFCKKCSPSWSFCHLHLSTLGVGRCCNRKTLFKCHKSQTECLECSKTPGRRSGTPPLLSVLRARASALQASRL